MVRAECTSEDGEQLKLVKKHEDFHNKCIMKVYIKNNKENE